MYALISWERQSAGVLNSKVSCFLLADPPFRSKNDPSVNLGPRLIMADSDVCVNTVCSFCFVWVTAGPLCLKVCPDAINHFHFMIIKNGISLLSLHCDVMHGFRFCVCVRARCACLVYYFHFKIRHHNTLDRNYEPQAWVKQPRLFVTLILAHVPLNPWILFLPCSSSSLF